MFRVHDRTNPEEWLAAVNGYRAQMGMTDTQIIQVLSKVLRPHIITWDKFVDVFRKVFLPSDNQEQIWRGILDRFQSVDESLLTFVAHVL